MDIGFECWILDIENREGLRFTVNDKRILALMHLLSRTLSRTYFRDEADKLVRLLVEIDKMTAKLACVWKKREEHTE